MTKQGPRPWEKHIEELRTLLAQKNADYADPSDPLENFREFGLKGIVVRIGDKFRRLVNLTWREKEAQVSSETLRDTLRDLAGYALIGIVWLDEEGKE